MGVTQTTTTLSPEMIKHLDTTFLERSEALTLHLEGAKKKKLGQNMGTTTTFTKRSPLAPATDALTEGENPDSVGITSNQVTATLKGYGSWTKLSSLAYKTGIDRAAKETTEVMAQNASETIDAVVRNALHAGATVQFAGGKSALTGITNDDILTVKEIKKAVRTLKKNNAIVYPDGYFLGKVGPDTSYNIMDDAAWVDAQKYTAREELYKGEIGKIHKVRFVEVSSNQKTESSTTTVYSNFIHGQEAFAAIDLSGEGLRKLIIKQPNRGDTSNPLNQFMTIGWKAEAFAAAVLDQKWIINIKTGAKD